MKLLITTLIAAFCGTALAADGPDGKENKQEDMVAFYVGFDGVSFSTSGTKFGRFKEHLDRETAIKLSDAELKALIDALKKAGLDSEDSRKAENVDVIPLFYFAIHVAAAGLTEDFVFYREGLTVPIPPPQPQSPTEDVVALWLIEGIRKGKMWGSLDPVCYKHADNRTGRTSDCQPELLAAYRKWWEQVKTWNKWNRNDVEPLTGTGLWWY